MRWKWILTTFVVVIVVLLGAGYAIISNYNYNNLKPQVAQAFQQATGRKLTLAGDVRLKVGFAPTIEVQDVGIQNAAWGSQPEMAKVKRFELQVGLFPLLFGHIDVKRLILIDPDILIETDKSGKSNLDFMTTAESAKATPAPATKQKKVALTVNELSIEQGRITYRNEKSGKTYIAKVNSLTATAASAASPLKLKLKGSYDNQPFDASGTLLPLASFTGTAGPWPLHLTINTADASLTLAGTIKDVPNLTGIDIKFQAGSKDLQKLGRAVGESLPLKGSFAVSGRVTDPKPKVYEISDLKASLAQSSLTGSARLDVSRQRPLLTANLASQRLDLRPMMENPSKSKGIAAQAGKPASSGRQEIFSTRPLPLDSLRKADANLNFKVGELLLPRLALRNLSTHIILKDGRLTVKPLTAVAGGGAVNADFDLQPQGGTAKMQTAVTIDHLNAGTMLKELAVTNALEGLVNAKLNLTSRGSSMAGLMAGLNGKIVVLMHNGRITNKYASLLGSDLGSSLLGLINPLSKQEPYTQIECFVGGFNIRNGIADTTALVVNTDYMSLISDGKIDLRTERLDLRLNPIPKQGIGTKLTGKLNLSLSELARPFKLQGTLSHPKLGLDLTQTGIIVGKALGGLLTMGPVGLAGALAGTSSETKDLCSLATEAAQKGVKLAVLEKQGQKQSTAAQAAQGVQKDVGEVGKQLLKLFGN